MVSTPLRYGTKMRLRTRKESLVRRRRYSYHGQLMLLPAIAAAMAHLPSLVSSTNANPNPYRLKQPDGTETPPILLTGSPHYHQLEDKDGYTVVNDASDGFVKYGSLDPNTGEVVPTEYKMGAVDEDSGETISPEKLGLEKKVAPTEEAIARQCGQFCVDEQQSKEGWEPPKREGKQCKGLLCSISRRGGDGGGGVRAGLLTTVGFDRLLRGSQQLQEESQSARAARQLQAERKNRHRKLSAVQDGKLLNVVIPIQFADHPDENLPLISHIDTLFNAVNGHPKICPTGSVRDVFFSSSYGKLTVVSTVVPWIKLSKPQAYYAGGASGMAPQFQEALVEALDYLESDPNFTFREFDANGDGLIDAITYVHSGYGSEWGGVDCTATEAGVGDRIWSHKWKLSPNTWTSGKDGVLVEEYHISPALHGRCGREMGRIGTISHELGHFLGLPDLYGGNSNSGNGIGSFGLMGNSWGWDSTQSYPPIASSWSKIEMGWMSPSEISESGRYYLPPIATNPKAFKISRGFPEGEYLLIENRQPLGFDAKMPIGGIVIWHIDELALHNVAAGYPGSDGWPANGKHFRVSIVPADSSYSLEKGDDRGAAGHVFRPGDELSSDANQFPSTASYQDGVIAGTGIRIFDIKEIKQSGKDTIMKFSVLFEGDTMPPSVAPTAFPTIESPEPQLFSREIVTTFAGGTGSFGSQFDVKAVRDITVTHFAVHSKVGPTEPAMEIEVYTKADTFVGSEYTETDWDKICCNRPIPSAGLAKRTIIPTDAFFESVEIAAGQTQAFYITAKEPVLRYTKAQGAMGDIMSGNLDVQVLTGGGVGYYPFGQQAPNRDYNGIVFYDTIDIVRSKESSNFVLPTYAPNSLPLPEPTLSTGSASSSSTTSDTTGTTGITPSTTPPSPSTLQTSSFAGNVGSFGIFFDLMPLKDMELKSLSFHTDLTTLTQVQVYFRRGTYVGHERDASAWQLICDTEVFGRGFMALTPISQYVFQTQHLAAAERVAFYVTLQTPNLRYSKADVGVTDGGTNTDLHIYPGSGVGNYPFGTTVAPRLFDGQLNYETIVVPTAEPTLEPTVYIPPDIAQNQQEVITTFASGNGGYGSMFDVTAKPDRTLILKTLDIHTDSLDEVDVQVFMVFGSYAPHSFDAAAWTLICETRVRGEGYFARTRLPEEDFAKVAIPGGETRGFYVSLRSPSLRYSEVTAVSGRRRLQGEEDLQVGSVWSATRDVAVHVGAGLALDKWSGLYEPRVYNGALVYACVGEQCEAEDDGVVISTFANYTDKASRSVSPTPTALPSPSPSRRPTAHPTLRPSSIPTSAAPTATRDTGVLTTIREGGSGAFGNVFDVKIADGIPGVEISSFDIYTDRTISLEVEVWSIAGSALGAEFPSSKWHIICKTKVLGAGSDEFTPLPPDDFKPVQISKHVPVMGFLIVATTPDIRYTPDPSKDYGVLSSDEYILVRKGDGAASYPYRGTVSGATTPHRKFNGRVHYTVLASPPSLPSPPPQTTTSSSPFKSLATPRDANSAAYGNLFDVALNDGSSGLTIESIDFYTERTDRVKVEVWTRRGSGLGADFPDSSWTLIGKSEVTGAGQGAFTGIPKSDFNAVELSSRIQLRSFIVMLFSPAIRYTVDETKRYGVLTSDDHISIFKGNGITSYPGTRKSSFAKHRNWNGRIHYKIGAPPATSSAPGGEESAAAPPSSTSVLSTMKTGGSGSFGNLFDLRKHPSSPGVIVEYLEIYTDLSKEITVEVWTKEGSAIGAPFPDASWEMVSKATLPGAGRGSFTTIPASQFKPVEVSASVATRGFLVILTSPDLRYTPHEKGEYPPAEEDYGIIAHDANIAITSGDGVGMYPYRTGKRGGTTKFRAWNGAVHYKMLP